MDIKEYLNIKRGNGELVNIIVNDLQKNRSFQNILFLRTPITGEFMDAMMRDENTNQNITRILYTLDKKITNSLYTILTHSELETHLRSLDKKYDLIIMDPYHEYKESSSDFALLSSFLSENGILVSHDCSPSNNKTANPKYIRGAWSGVTYICFIELAYNNPEWYYAVIDNDTGVGIASKQKIDNLTKDLNKEKQEILLQMNANNNPNMYNYFRRNAKELINLYS